MRKPIVRDDEKIWKLILGDNLRYSILLKRYNQDIIRYLPYILMGRFSIYAVIDVQILKSSVIYFCVILKLDGSLDFTPVLYLYCFLRSSTSFLFWNPFSYRWSHPFCSLIIFLKKFELNLQIIDEKSLIKKYQQEIQCLKEELEQLKRGIVTVQPKDTGDADIELLKQKVGNVIYKSRPCILFDC